MEEDSISRPEPESWENEGRSALYPDRGLCVFQWLLLAPPVSHLVAVHLAPLSLTSNPSGLPPCSVPSLSQLFGSGFRIGSDNPIYPIQDLTLNLYSHLLNNKTIKVSFATWFYDMEFIVTESTGSGTVTSVHSTRTQKVRWNSTITYSLHIVEVFIQHLQWDDLLQLIILLSIIVLSLNTL